MLIYNQQKQINIVTERNFMYDYIEAVRSDIKDYILENYDRNDLADFDDEDDFKDYLIDILVDEDSITGNMSGSYYCNSYKAQEALNGNIDLLRDACETLDLSNEEVGERFLDGDFEYFDCIVRCYIATRPSVIENVVDELLEENNDFIIEWNEAHSDEEEGLDD